MLELSLAQTFSKKKECYLLHILNTNFFTPFKDTDYDVDGGFWDSIGDWFGEDFDYSTVDNAVGNFYNCCAKKVAQVLTLHNIFHLVSRR